MKKGNVLQVGYLQELYRDARSTEHKILFRLSFHFKVVSVVAKLCSHPFGTVSCPCRLYMPFAWNV